MNKYFPLHCHSEFSLKDGITKIKHIPSRLEELGCPGMALTDHGSIAGSVSFYKKLTKTNLQPVLGIEHYISRNDCTIKTPENRQLDHLLILAKNTNGWKNLLNLTHHANECFYHNPRLDLNTLSGYTNDLIGISGHLGSVLASHIIIDDKVQPNWQHDATWCAQQLEEIFGKGNFYLEVQLINGQHPLVPKLADCVRQISKITNIPTVATPDAHYLRREDDILQQIMICENLNIKIKNGPTSGMSAFFNCNDFHIPSYDEMKEYGNTDEELAHTLDIASMCEDYDILHQPEIPPYECPDDHSEYSWLRQQCWDGWHKKIENIIPKDQQQIYIDRVKYELQVLKDAKLSGYFLTIKDIVDYGRTLGLMGCGRGSVAGSLIAYLLDITRVDSIKYNLIFERFFNAGRIADGKFNLPDIDVDVPKNNRGKILEYISNRFGQDRTCQVSTYSTLGGRNALKAVLRSYGDISFTEVNDITKYFPDPAKISAELQEQEERDLDSSIIRYVLENDKKGNLRDWCFIDEDGNLQGKMSKRFAQAIALEGTKINRSTHAAGIVISPLPIRDSIPVVYDTKHKRLSSSLEMNDLEATGMVKFDLLGLATLDKNMGAQQILQFGDIVQ